MVTLEEPQVIRNDSLSLIRTFGAIANPQLGLGTARDKSTSVAVNTLQQKLNGIELATIAETGVGSRAVHLYPTDAGEAWCRFKVAKGRENPEEGFFEYWDELRDKAGGMTLREAFIIAAACGRQDGDGYIVIGARDGRSQDQPIDRERLRSIDWVRVMTCYELKPYSWRKNPLMPEHYRTVTDAGKEILWHRDRVYRFPGFKLLPEGLKRNNGHNLSVIQAMFNSYSKREQSLQSGVLMIINHQLRKMAMKGLSNVLRADKASGRSEGEEMIFNRLLSLDMGSSAARTLLHDMDNETIENLNISYGGVDAIITKVEDAWISDTDMPRVLLLNALGATGLTSGEAYRMAMYDWAFRVQSWAGVHWQPHLQHFAKLTIAAQDSPVRRESMQGWKVEIPLNLKLTPAEQMDLELKAADRSTKLVNIGAITPPEVRQGYAGSDFNIGLVLDESTAPDFEAQQEMKALDLEERKASVKQAQQADKPASRKDYSYVKRILKFNDIEIGVEYLPGDKRFGKKLPSSYGHLRRYIGEDGEALDCYVSREATENPSIIGDRPIFRVTQLDADGDLDEFKFFLGFESKNQAEDVYKSLLPLRFFGGIVEMNLGDLQSYRRQDTDPRQNFSQGTLDPEHIRQDYALGLLDRVTALTLLGYEESEAITQRSDFQIPQIQQNTPFDWETYLREDVFREADHPRDSRGRFAKKGTGTGASPGSGASTRSNKSATPTKVESSYAKARRLAKEARGGLSVREFKAKQEKTESASKNKKIVFAATTDIKRVNKDLASWKNDVDEMERVLTIKQIERRIESTKSKKQALKTIEDDDRYPGITGIGTVDSTRYFKTRKEADESYEKHITTLNILINKEKQNLPNKTSKYLQLDIPQLIPAISIAGGLVSGSSSKAGKKVGIYDEKETLQASAQYTTSTKGKAKYVYVNELATAPWNNIKGDPQSTRGAGTKAIAQLIEESRAIGGEGRIRLFPLDGAKPFYEKIGFKKMANSVDWELTPKAASEFLARLGAE